MNQQTDDETARRLGRYRLEQLISVGGMAEIYRARFAGIGGFERVCVVKRILPELAADPTFVSMFLDEARITVALQHPNIVQVFDLGRKDDNLYLAMEYVDGRNLSSIVKSCERHEQELEFSFALHVVAEVLKALDHAHTAKLEDGTWLKIVHRDVSPSNVLISRSGVVKLGDFGVASAVIALPRESHRRMVGKYRYMAPEVAAGGDPTPYSDLFAAGAILYELVVGESLLPQGTYEEVQEYYEFFDPEVELAVREDELQGLEVVLERALATDPEERYRSADEFLDSLGAYMLKNNIRISERQVAEFLQRLDEADGITADAMADGILPVDDTQQADGPTEVGPPRPQPVSDDDESESGGGTDEDLESSLETDQVKDLDAPLLGGTTSEPGPLEGEAPGPPPQAPTGSVPPWPTEEPSASGTPAPWPDAIVPGTSQVVGAPAQATGEDPLLGVVGGEEPAPSAPGLLDGPLVGEASVAPLPTGEEPSVAPLDGGAPPGGAPLTGHDEPSAPPLPSSDEPSVAPLGVETAPEQALPSAAVDSYVDTRALEQRSAAAAPRQPAGGSDPWGGSARADRPEFANIEMLTEAMGPDGAPADPAAGTPASPPAQPQYPQGDQAAPPHGYPPGGAPPGGVPPQAQQGYPPGQQPPGGAPPPQGQAPYSQQQPQYSQQQPQYSQQQPQYSQQQPPYSQGQPAYPQGQQPYPPQQQGTPYAPPQGQQPQQGYPPGGAPQQGTPYAPPPGQQPQQGYPPGGAPQGTPYAPPPGQPQPQQGYPPGGAPQQGTPYAPPQGYPHQQGGLPPGSEGSYTPHGTPGTPGPQGGYPPQGGAPPGGVPPNGVPPNGVPPNQQPPWQGAPPQQGGYPQGQPAGTPHQPPGSAPMEVYSGFAPDGVDVHDAGAMDAQALQSDYDPLTLEPGARDASRLGAGALGAGQAGQAYAGQVADAQENLEPGYVPPCMQAFLFQSEIIAGPMGQMDLQQSLSGSFSAVGLVCFDGGSWRPAYGYVPPDQRPQAPQVEELTIFSAGPRMMEVASQTGRRRITMWSGSQAVTLIVGGNQLWRGAAAGVPSQLQDMLIEEGMEFHQIPMVEDAGPAGERKMLEILEEKGLMTVSETARMRRRLNRRVLSATLDWQRCRMLVDDAGVAPPMGGGEAPIELSQGIAFVARRVRDSAFLEGIFRDMTMGEVVIRPDLMNQIHSLPLMPEEQVFLVNLGGRRPLVELLYERTGDARDSIYRHLFLTLQLGIVTIEKD